MSVQTLRAAATELRATVHGGGLVSDPDFKLAVADWLDTAGADLWAHGPLCICGTGCDACDDNLWEPHARAALAVAGAVLGN